MPILILKKILKIFLIVILILIGLSVIRIKPSRIAYGQFAGECIGNCGTIYEITSKGLRVDTTSFWQSRNGLGKFKIKGQRIFEESKEKYFDTKKISIPLIMLIDPRTRFGCPDCHDQGGYYLDYTLFGIRRYFEIDKESEPLYFVGLTKNIDNKIDEINVDLSKYGRTVYTGSRRIKDPSAN